MNVPHAIDRLPDHPGPVTMYATRPPVRTVTPPPPPRRTLLDAVGSALSPWAAAGLVVVLGAGAFVGHAGWTGELPFDAVVTSPPYPGLIDYHEQHRYAYELLGLDDVAMASWDVLDLTTVLCDRNELAAEAVDLITRAIRGLRVGPQVRVPVGLVLRGTHAPPPPEPVSRIA